jgi:hypothetical protein
MKIVDVPKVRNESLSRMHSYNKNEGKQKHLRKPLKYVTPR